MATFWRDTDRSPVTVQKAMGEWSLVGWDVLEEVATKWRRTITEARFAVDVQKRSGIITSLPDDAWVPTVLSLVAQRAREDRAPAITAFIVDEQGKLPTSYDEALRLDGLAGGSESMREQHALDARLMAHRIYGARMPMGASTDDLVVATRVPGTRGRPRGTGPAPTTRTVAPEPPRAKVCPSCYIQLPATGQCDYCF